MLANTGHIQTLICPPGKAKSRYWMGPDSGPDPDAWRASAQECTGTWWEHWAGWMVERSGVKKTAPETLGSRAHPVLDDAPGSYVLVEA